MTSVTAVVVVYGEAPLLSQCVDRLLESTGVETEVIVVDNGCTDGSVLSLGERAQLLKVVAPYNGGFGAGCNIGAALAKADVVAFVNPDAIPDDAALAHLASTLEDPTVGIAMGSIRLINDRDILNSAGGAIH